MANADAEQADDAVTAAASNGQKQKGSSLDS